MKLGPTVEQVNLQPLASRTRRTSPHNMSLRRLIKRIAITEVGTFRIEPDDFSWWLFDASGKLLEGRYVLS